MSDSAHCPKCSQPIPTGSPGGICPACLIQAGLDGKHSEFVTRTHHSPAGATAGFAPPEIAQLTPLFPQLELIRVLGHGGMGAVYLARQKSLDRMVALKIIRPESAGVQGFAERFSREARAMARLNHPGIVGVYDFGTVTGAMPANQPQAADFDPSSASSLFFLLMEFVDGASLRQLIADKALTSAEALAIVPQICEALQFAHDMGVVHRDIKPENILVDQHGRVKIADFGLAKLTASDSAEHSLTGTHQIMGTPRYMAPEQLEQSRSIDHRADIYSLGVVFYEMLTGEVPMGMFEPPSRKASVDVRLDQVVLRSLAREPERRYQNASEIKTDLDLVNDNLRLPVQQRSAVQNESLSVLDSDQQQAPSSGLVSRYLSHIDGWVILVSCLGALSCLLPFKAVTIGGMLPQVQLAVHGFEVPACRIATGIFLLLPLLLLIDGFGKTNRATWRPIATSLVGFLVLLLLAMDWAGMMTPVRWPTERIEIKGVNFDSLFAGALGNGLFVSPQIGLVFSSLAAGVLLAIGSLQLIVRSDKFTRASSSVKNDSAKLSARVGRAATSLSILGWLAIPSLLLTASLIAVLPSSNTFQDQPKRNEFSSDASNAGFAIRSGQEPDSDSGTASVGSASDGSANVATASSSDQLRPTTTLLLLFLVVSTFAFVTIPIVLIAAGRMRDFQSRWLVLLGVVLIMLPFNLIAIAGIPFGIWILIVLMRADVRQAFESRTVSIATTLAQLRRAGIWLLVSGILAFFTFAGVAISALVALASTPPAPEDYVSLTVSLGMVVATLLLLALLQVVSAFKFMNQSSIRWSYTAAILGLIPCTPFWFISCPSAIYALAVLGQPTDGVKHNLELFGAANQLPSA